MWRFKWWPKQPPRAVIETASHFGPARRQPNEDYVVAESDPENQRCLIVVADGMGGFLFGEEASQCAATTVLTHWRRHGKSLTDADPAKIRAGIVDAVTAADEALTALISSKNIEGGKMGTTIVVAVQVGRRLHVGWVGDSRAYVLSGGKLTQITTDHNWAEDARRLGISEEVIRHLGLRHSLSHHLGGKCKVDYVSCDINAGDILLVCSDGLTSVISDKRICQILLQKTSIKSKTDQLMREALNAPARDNVTVALASFNL